MMMVEQMGRASELEDILQLRVLFVCSPVPYLYFLKMYGNVCVII